MGNLRYFGILLTALFSGAGVAHAQDSDCTFVGTANGNVPITLACAPNAQLSRAGINLLDALPEEGGDSRLWLRSQYYSTVKEASADGHGNSYIALAGADATIGAQDQWTVGGGVGVLTTATNADYRPLATFDLKTSGIGPIGYLRYTPYTSKDGGSQVWLRAQGGYLFLHNSSRTTTFGVPYQASKRGGDLFVGDLGLAFSRKISRDRDDFFRASAGFRLVKTRYQDPLGPSRNDDLLYARLGIDHEFALKWRLSAGLGVDVPLDRYSVGVTASGAAGAARQEKLFGKAELGLRYTASDRLTLAAGVIGSKAADFHEIGGMFRIRYTFAFDNRVQN
jgi:hypothetical protein